MNEKKAPIPFNSSLETGVRALVILVSNFPRYIDIERLVDFDYLVVHSGDVDGPKSLHPPLPMREGELLIRRGIIESGLLLMMSRGLINRVVNRDGIYYEASDTAKPFLDSCSTAYMKDLIKRSAWVTESFGDMPNETLQRTINSFFDKWTTQFSLK